MEATRVGRNPRRGRRAVPPDAEATEVMPSPVWEEPSARPPAPLNLARLALVVCVLSRARAEALLDGLGERDAERAKEHLSLLVAMPSAQRQARVAVEFGVVQDAAERLRALMEESSEPLRRELFRRLPPYHRSLFPGRAVEPPDATATGALCTLAERLIREATR
ncbi:hypothetical protein P2318_26100 [Myxococcaceae bacterium GXIMD 01537]